MATATLESDRVLPGATGELSECTSVQLMHTVYVCPDSERTLAGRMLHVVVSVGRDFVYLGVHLQR